MTPVVQIITPAGKWLQVDTKNMAFTPRLNHCLVLVDNPTVGRRIYSVGGYDWIEIDIYHPINGTWTKGAKPPIVLNHMQCVAAQGKLWIMAPYTGAYPNNVTNFAYMYNPANNTWHTKTALPLARRRGSAAVMVSHDERLLYVSHGTAGGHEIGGDVARSLPYLDAYDIATDSWTALSDTAPHPRDHAGGARLGHLLCVAGGRLGGEDNWPLVDPTDCYNLVTGQWEIKASIPVLKNCTSYATTCDGRLIVAGGDGAGTVYNSVHVFNGTAWTTIDDLVVARHCSGLVVDCACRQMYMLSGSQEGGVGVAMKSMETYFPNGTVTGCKA
jgi:hypothetical protein